MISPSDFTTLVTHIEEKTGITLPQTNYEVVKKYVSEIIEKKSISFSEYLTIIARMKNEYNDLLAIVTINETYFFREEKQFIFLSRSLFPWLKENNETINIWSSSCSSGEEALSLYALAHKVFERTDQFKIFASDVSDEILTKFKRAKYRPNSFRQDGTQFHENIKAIAREQQDGTWQINPEHMGRLHVFNSNLFSSDISKLPLMDIIFLRNTLIYMNQENKRIIIDNVVNRLKVGGALFLATTEVPLISHPALFVQEEGCVYYFKKRDPRSLSSESLSQKISETVLDKKEKPFNVQELIQQRRELRKLNKKANNEGFSPRTDSSSPQETVPKKKAVNEDEVCNIIYMRLNNRAYEQKDEQLETAADLIMKLLDCINKHDVSQVESCLLQKPELTHIVPGLFHFFSGHIHYKKGESLEAAQLFEKSLKYNKALWPAQFYLLKLHRGSQREKRAMALSLIEEIKNYIGQRRYDYQFLLEGFNARYFLLISEKICSHES